MSRASLLNGGFRRSFIGSGAGSGAQAPGQRLPMHHTAEEPGRRVILQVVGKRVDIAFGDEWNGRQPRTRIVAIGAHDGVDGAALREAFDRCRRYGARAGRAAPRYANA